jgi:uncharacterized Zn finger protein
MAGKLSEQAVAEMAPNDKALLDGRGLVKKGALKKLAKNDDGTLVFGLCQGSGKSPYEVSMDLATGSDRPTLRCTCPSRQFPCKHQIGLMLAFVANGAAFPVAAPPAALLDKRQKLVERAEKKAAAPAEDKPKAVNKAAQTKKTQEQADALDTLETFVVDLVSAGLGGLTSKSIKAIDTQAKRMADAQMSGAAAALQHLSALVSDEGDDDDDDDDGKKAMRGIEEERQAQIAALVTQLWVTIRKGKKALEGLLEEGASKSEADAQLESILGRAWKLYELKEAGYWVTERALIELAHERADDPVREFVGATGYLLDLGDGTVVREWTSLPAAAMRFAKLRASRAGVLAVKEAALYPGDVVNRRIRWDEDSSKDVVSERPRAASDYARLHALAGPIEPLVKALRGQLKNPLNPSDAIGLVVVQRFGAAGDALCAEDAAGGRIVIRDPKKAAFATSRNLRYAVGAFGPGSLAVRLYFDLRERAIFGQALALIVGDKHIRLGV